MKKVIIAIALAAGLVALGTFVVTSSPVTPAHACDPVTGLGC